MKKAIDGIIYHVDTCGNGFPLVLLHGFTGNGTTWNSFCSGWGTHSKMWMVDVIGHGKTDAPEQLSRYNIISAAEDLHSLLNVLGIEKADFLGYSMGGRLALTFAVNYPDRVRKLILESSTAGLQTEAERKSRMLQDESLARFIQTRGIAGFVDYWENIPLFSSQQNLPAAKRKQIRQQRLTNSALGLVNSLIGMGTGSQPSWWEHLHKVNTETYLITGAYDQKFCEIAEQMNRKLKTSRVITVEKCGHAIHVEDPEKFGTIISEILSNT